MDKKVVILGILVLLWMGFIFFMSSIPGDESGESSSSIVTFIIDKYDLITGADEERINYHNSEDFLRRANLYFRKFCHFSEYCILSILLLSFLFSLHKYSFFVSVFLNLLITIFYAGTDEYHQIFVRGRSGTILDVMIDSSGIIFGIILAFMLNNVLKKE